MWGKGTANVASADSPTEDYSDCIQLKAVGSTRFEHKPIDLGQSRHRQAHLGKVSEEEMSQLAALRDDPPIKLNDRAGDLDVEPVEE